MREPTALFCWILQGQQLSANWALTDTRHHKRSSTFNPVALRPLTSTKTQRHPNRYSVSVLLFARSLSLRRYLMQRVIFNLTPT